MTDNAGPRIEYIEARRVLLDALTALQPRDRTPGRLSGISRVSALAKQAGF